MKNYCFDLETAPLDSDSLSLAIPPFDENEVKVGNLGPEKKAEKIAKLKAEHEERFYRRAALSAVSGRIVAVGIMGPTEIDKVLMFGDEPDLIRFWFEAFSESIRTGDAHWIGFNIASFDLPFIIRRAWCLDIPIPAGISMGRYLSNWFTDLVNVWRSTEYRADLISLSDLARFLGYPGKAGNGADFAQLLRYDPDKAKIYLTGDLWLTWQIASRLGALRPDSPIAAQTKQFQKVESTEPGFRFY